MSVLYKSILNMTDVVALSQTMRRVLFWGAKKMILLVFLVGKA